MTEGKPLLEEKSLKEEYEKLAIYDGETITEIKRDVITALNRTIEKIEKTRQEVINYFGVSEKDLEEWYALNACPKEYQSAFSKIKVFDYVLSLLRRQGGGKG